MYSANDLPPIQAKDDAFFRRIMMLHIKSAPKERRIDFEENLHSEVQHLIRLCMDALSYMYTMTDITKIETEESRELVEYWESKGNTVSAFLKDMKPFETVGRIEKGEFERMYSEYCQREDRTAFKRLAIKNTMINKGYQVVTIHGRDYYKDPTFIAKEPDFVTAEAEQLKVFGE
jgi:phage/plasmid-associated DNA primase